MLISLGVLRRKKNAHSLLADIEVNGPTLLDELESNLAPRRKEGQEAPDYQAQLEEFENLVRQSLEELEHDDDLHIDEVKKDRAARQERDDVTVKLHREVVDSTISIDRNHGAGTAEKLLGLGKGLLALPDHVHEVTRRAVKTLGEPGFTFPGEGLEGIKVIPEDLKAQLEGPLDLLSAALTKVRQGKRKFNDTLRRKRRSIAEFDDTYSIVADWLKTMYRAAGLDSLAERVRPTIPRASKASDEEVVDDSTGEPRDETAAEGSDAEKGTAETATPDPAAEASTDKGKTPVGTATADASASATHDSAKAA